MVFYTVDPQSVVPWRKELHAEFTAWGSGFRLGCSLLYEQSLIGFRV